MDKFGFENALRNEVKAKLSVRSDELYIILDDFDNQISAFVKKIINK